MRFLFIIQGEGRGHMTQAIAMYDLLTKAGHQVNQVVIGSSKRRKIPPFVLRRFNCPIELLESPNFVSDQSNKSVNIRKTIWHNTKALPTYLNSLQRLHCLVSDVNPEVILNFYDFLAGVYQAFFRPRSLFVCIGHQYLTDHSSFPWAKNRRFAKQLFLLANNITSWGCYQRIALSLRSLKPEDSSGELLIWPPLLRGEIQAKEPIDGDFLLVYVVNPGYIDDIVRMGRSNPNLKMEVFSDGMNQNLSGLIPANVRFHPLDDRNFIEKLAGCRALVCTAGFESICEALFLKKPVMVVPVAGQYEQACNALDMEIAGAGIWRETFDLQPFLDYLESDNPKDGATIFSRWYTEQQEKIDQWLQDLALKLSKEKTTHPSTNTGLQF
ncbi:hypothetical protein ADIS_4763 [Lunatimonas lonarensis]|uniref:Glycosyltransferase n=1 Tax=Lunatimonas lonarensis TaxID=1232681 RepID=R7ZL42_9BACT|nr:glycosyltransferase family protein [Lunatimonas lonarensis]EON74792.1 hypothetical protein ADIS_4763 [Lunatimonas lonarensis]